MRTLLFSVLLVVLSACAAFKPTPSTKPLYWPSGAFPLIMRSSTRCTAELWQALDLWNREVSRVAGEPVRLFTLTRDAPFDSQPPPKQVWIIDGELSAPLLGQAERWPYFLDPRSLHSVLITIDPSYKCNAWTLAHEIGHALGLQHSAYGCLMFAARVKDANTIHDDEALWVWRQVQGLAEYD